MSALLDVRDLRVTFATRRGPVEAVSDASFALARGETLGIVGESGSGKSVTSYAIMRILDQGGRVTGGAIRYGGIDLLTASEAAMRDLRGREISMIFQNPRAALNPIRKVGRQIEDVLIQHKRAVGGGDAKRRAIAALEAVKINDATARYHAYPFELSGGMCQRIVIALALACEPRLLIADEPTTGLDVTTQKAVLDLMVALIRERAMSAILITHDLGLASAYCDRIAVMRHGVLIETAPAARIFHQPREDYTKRLMRATPRQGVALRELLPEAKPPLAPRVPGPPLLEVEDLAKTFGPVRAVEGVSFAVRAGETVGLVGESGSGKSTISAMVVRLLDPSGGSIRLDGEEIGAIPAKAFAHHTKRAALQMVFQDATDSLNPRMTAAQAIDDPLARLGKMAARARRARVEELADLVGLPRHLLSRFPHQLSGGQKARVGIARAIALSPKLLVLDEPTAALDVSIQAVVLNLLADLRAELGLAYLFVSHDLEVVRLLCDRVLVMKSGRIVEAGATDDLLRRPQHAYTRELLAAAQASG